MGLFRRKRKDVPNAGNGPAEPAEKGPGRPKATAELTALVERLAVPAASLAPGSGAPASGTSSYVAGHPYLPDGTAWPTYADQPMFFLCQINLADAPDLPDFPKDGLLQWFVGADDTHGLTFDDTEGTVGFEVRWYADLSAPSSQAPTTPTPWHQAGDLDAPIDTTDATALEITGGRMIPTYAELPDDLALEPVLEPWAKANGEDPDDPEFVWNEYVRGVSGPFTGFINGSNIGGSADFTQEDPRGRGNYPASTEPGGRMLVEIDSNEFGGWGDSGIAHLFGNPAALVAGDLTSVRYQWDCA